MVGKKPVFFMGEIYKDGKACTVYHSSYGFSRSRVACGTTQKISPKVFQDSEEEEVETKNS